MTFDELDPHQRLLDRPLRSLTPVGVIQELYALLIAHYAVRSLMHQAALQESVLAGPQSANLRALGAWG